MLCISRYLHPLKLVAVLSSDVGCLGLDDSHFSRIFVDVPANAKDVSPFDRFKVVSITCVCQPFESLLRGLSRRCLWIKG